MAFVNTYELNKVYNLFPWLLKRRRRKHHNIYLSRHNILELAYPTIIKVILKSFLL